MKKINSIFLVMALLIAVLATSCNKNYYSGSRKGSNCGCPSNPR